MSSASLYDFNPRATGHYEARLWKAYYDRDWPLALVLVFQLLRSQFHLSPLQAVAAAYYSVRAALAWAPHVNDPQRVRALLICFYAVLRAATQSQFNPVAAGTAELEYWTVHRRFDGHIDQPELADALSAIASVVYTLPRASAYPAGVARARACDLVDAITGGRQAPTRDAWAAVEHALQEAYSLLRREVVSRRPAACATGRERMTVSHMTREIVERRDHA